MKRILVMGVSAGAGKSTFARRLSELLSIDVHHLDVLYWRPNWKEAPLEEFRDSQWEIVTRDQWIMEGNYTNTYDIREQHADTIIYLELPLAVCLYRVIKRRILNHGRTRPDMREGCNEKLDYQFIKFIITTYYPRKRKMRERFEVFKQMDPKNRVIVLKGKKEIDQYLEKWKLDQQSS